MSHYVSLVRQDEGARDPLLQGDAWTEPLEHVVPRPQVPRRLSGILELLLLLVVFVLGIYLVSSLELLQKYPLFWWFVIVVLCGDVSVLLFFGLSLAIIRVCCGGSSVQHALAGCSILLHSLQAVCCYSVAGFGFYLLARSWRDVLRENLTLFIFMVLVLVLAVAWSLETCPTLWGAFNFAVSKLTHSITARPVVTFQDPGQDHVPVYAHWQEYHHALARFTAPIAKSSGATRIELPVPPPSDIKQPADQATNECSSELKASEMS